MKLSASYLRLFAVCILAATTATLASAFEGKVEMKTTVGSDSTPMTYFMKGSLMRIEMKAPPEKRKKDDGTFVMIINMETRETTMLMDKDKMYMVHKLPEASAEQANKKGDVPEFKPTGRKEEIAGIDAEEYVGVSEKKRTEVWVTKELGKFMMANQGGPMGGRKGSASASAWEKFAQQENFFPLRTIRRAKEDGPEEMRMEVTLVDMSKLPDSLFQPPADYQKFEMPNMGDMMKGMIPGH